ncbi:MAG: SIR2 family protein [Zoogloea sp.]|uniref:SIR2 family protein n=1 Tax=Zoogloea sp. TaxID=49181 RepID=UPI003F3A2E5D
MSLTIPSDLLAQLHAGLASGEIVPYLGPGALAHVTHKVTGKPIPADSNSLILAMNNGQPMAPRLMYEFPRAAMNVELKRGRGVVNKFLTTTYDSDDWTESAFHAWLAGFNPDYVIDVNRDIQFQQQWAGTPHILVVGIARMAGTAFRYRLYQHDGEKYAEVSNESVDSSLPVLFKPMGTPRPNPDFIASDADYVDYITELMGGFSIPPFLKARRVGKRYLFLGLRLNRDTERMVMSDIIYDCSTGPAAWAVIEEPTAKERRFCARMGIEIIEAPLSALLGEALEAA